MWRRIESLTKVLVVLATIAAGLMAVSHHVQAQELNFAAIEGRPAAVASMPAAALDFSAIAGSPTPWTINAAALNFDVLAEQPLTAPVEPPTVRPSSKVRLLVYGNCKICSPCRQLKSEWNALSDQQKAELDYYLEFREEKIPSWVLGTPTVHWNTEDGPKFFDFSDSTLHGSYLNELEARVEATNLQIKQKRRDHVTGHIKGWQRRYAIRAFEIAEAKLQEDPNISESDLRKHVKESMALPPGLMTLLAPLINYILQMLLNRIRPTHPEPAMHNSIFWVTPSLT